MDAHRVHGLVVVDNNGAVAGVLSQTDLLRARVVEHLWTNLKGLAVRHVMSAPAITISLAATLDDAAELMEQRRVHRLVVVGPDGTTPVGVLSVTDLVHVMAGASEMPV
jgi:CBS domain-containing protein